MSIRVGIDGFGHIGRNVLRTILESGRHDIEVVGINDLGPVETNAHHLRYDTVHGRFPGKVTVKGDTISVGNGAIKVTTPKDAGQLPWKHLGVDVPLECTGVFTSKDKASAHLMAGAKRVLVAAPADSVDLTVVYGVNHDKLTKERRVVSNASCTANCLGPVAKVLNNAVGIDKGFMTAIHSDTGDQPTLDTPTAWPTPCSRWASSSDAVLPGGEVTNADVADATRITASAAAINEIADKDGRVILLSHFGRPKGRDPKDSLNRVAACRDRRRRQGVDQARPARQSPGQGRRADHRRRDGEHILAAQGRRAGKSLYEPDLVPTARDTMGKAKATKREIRLPVDVRVAQKFEAHAPSCVVGVDHVGDTDMILDIGPRSVEHVISMLARAKTLVWNDPFGAFELEPFDTGTIEVAEAAAELTQARSRAAAIRSRRSMRPASPTA